MHRIAFAALACVMVVLPGCSAPEEPKLTAETYTLTLLSPPNIVSANSTFGYQLKVDGDMKHASDHIGGHFGNTSSSSPSTTVYPMACAHQVGELPDGSATFDVTCKAPKTVGIYYLRGHARVIDGNETFNWFSAEHRFTVAI